MNMNPLLRCVVVLVGLLAIPVSGQTRVFMAPDSVSIAPGDTVVIRVWVEDTVAAGAGALAGYDIRSSCVATPVGSTTGSVSHNPAPPAGTMACGAGATSPCVDESDTNWVFSGITAVAVSGPGPCPGAFPAVGGFVTFGVPPDVTTPRLLGEFAYTASPNAAGTFEISIQDPGVVSMLSSGISIPFSTDTPGATIHVVPVTTPTRVFLSPGDVTAQPGETVIFQVFVEGTVSAGVGKLASYGVVIECDGSPFSFGSVSHHPTPGLPLMPTSPIVNVTDPEWVYAGANISAFIFGTDSGDCPTARHPSFRVFASASEAVNVTTPKLLGEFAYKISPDAGAGSLGADPVILLKTTGGSPVTFLGSDVGLDIPFTFHANPGSSPFDGAIIHITEACCSASSPCFDIDPVATTLCTNLPSGEMMGPGSKCVPDGTFGTVDDACQPVVVPPGDDEWFTPNDGATFDFCETPIPADFFELGSQPFLGIISLGGGASPGGAPDTIVQRLEDLVFDAYIDPDCVFMPCMSTTDTCAQGCGFCTGPPFDVCDRDSDCPNGTCGALVSRVDVKIADLDLVNTQPIEVEMCTGAPVLWTVRATLSGPQDQGVLCACRTGENTGKFTAEFPVKPTFTFCKVSNPTVCVVFNPADPITLQTVGLSDFVFRTDFSQPFAGDNFAAGVKDDPNPDSQCCKLVCHDTAGAVTPGVPQPPGHQHCANGRISCDGCRIGACCSDLGSLPFGCTVVSESDCPPGDYRGAGTNCDDIDGDGIPGVFESGDCCGLRNTTCGTASNPNMWDTDGDSCSDGAEYNAGKDPCDPCDFPPGCVATGGLDCNGNGRDDLDDIATGCSLNIIDSANNVPDECECPSSCVLPTTKTYCLAGETSGMGWSWCIGDGLYRVCDRRVPGVAACQPASALVQPFINSINDAALRAGCATLVATKDPLSAANCFTVEACATPTFDLIVAEFGVPADGQPPSCTVDTAGCTVNPLIVEVILSGVDCDANGIDDAIDIALGTHADCQPNGIPDDCDIAGGFSPDSNGNGVPDECECCASSMPSDVKIPDSITGNPLKTLTTNRTLIIQAGGDVGCTGQAIRVTFTDLALPFDLWNGKKLWLGPPFEVSEISSRADATPPTQTWSQLQCTPECRADWDTFGDLHVYHEGIVPGSQYGIQVVDCANPDCMSNENLYSAPLTLGTAAYGDTVRDCSKAPCGPPEGPPVNTTDILAVLAKFSNALGAPRKARADLEPRDLDLVINVSDALHVINGFAGVPYPFITSVPDPCP